MPWQVGDPEIQSCRLIVDDSEVTTGTMDIYYFLDSGSGLQWIDTDESSLTATRTPLSALYDADVGWLHTLTPPISVSGQVVSWEMIHSVYGFVASGSNLVTVFDSGGGSSGSTSVKLQG